MAYIRISLLSEMERIIIVSVWFVLSVLRAPYQIR